MAEYKSVRSEGAAERLSIRDQWCLINLQSDQKILLSFKSKLSNSPNGIERNGSIRSPDFFSPSSAYNPNDHSSTSAAMIPELRGADAQLSSLKSELNMGGACHSELQRCITEHYGEWIQLPREHALCTKAGIITIRKSGKNRASTANA